MTNKVLKIITIENKTDEKFLRRKTADFGFLKTGKKELAELIKNMRKMMYEANGIGLSANQIGLNMRFFVAQIFDKSLKREMKFYAVFNPEIIKFSDKKVLMEEGCLSVPGLLGFVERPEKVTLVGFDKNGKKIKIKAWGLLARVFQHEIDHLNGFLYTDRAKKIFKETAEEIPKI